MTLEPKQTLTNTFQDCTLLGYTSKLSLSRINLPFYASVLLRKLAPFFTLKSFPAKMLSRKKKDGNKKMDFSTKKNRKGKKSKQGKELRDLKGFVLFPQKREGPLEI